ncbi:unnamed protein product [Ixodes pacificus]
MASRFIWNNFCFSGGSSMHDTEGILLSVDGDKGTTRASEGKGTDPLGVNALPPAWLCPEPCSFCRGPRKDFREPDVTFH